MRFLRCVQAEWLLLAPRFIRTRLGLTLLALGVALIWLSGRGLDPVSVVMQAGALGSILGAASVVGRENDRAALSLALTHPTTSLAIATGRWVVIVAPAMILAAACSIVVAAPFTTAVAGLAAAATVGSCALAVVLGLGNGAATLLFLFMAVAGAVPPERLVDLAHPGPVRLAAASALELGPALWHYRDIGAGDLGAVLHALAWTGLGVLLASAWVARRR